MAIVFPSSHLELIWIGLKPAGRRCNSPRRISRRDKIAPGISCLPTPLVRHVLYDPNACVVKGREALTFNTKNDCNNRPVAITKPRLGKRAYANVLSLNTGLPAW